MPPSVDKPERTPGGNFHRVAFDRYEMDLRSGELRKDGRKVRLQAQPFQLLAILIENAGEVVTRDEISRALWQTDTFVDFDHSVATAVNKIRETLCDSVDNPRFVETVPKRGYRFIGTIKPEAPVVMPVANAAPAVTVLAAAPTPKPLSGNQWILVLACVVATVLVATAVLYIYIWLARRPTDLRPETNPNSGAMTMLPFTSYPGQQTTPSFSPDGSRIAFSWDDGTSNRTGKPAYDLYVKAIGSETLLRLTHHPSDWISSTWSPDGTQIAFHRLAQDDNGIYVVPALGGPERKLIATHTPYSPAAPINWSPDGKWIAYADKKTAEPADRAYLLNVETLETHEFPHDPRCMHEGDLMFSHSGHELAILCVHNNSEFEYLITDFEGKSRRSIATRHEYPLGVVWSADDRSLLVAAEDADGDGLYDIRVSDGEVHKFSETAGEWPAVSNDGRNLAISVSDGHTSIWKKDLQHPQLAAVQMYSSTRAQNNAEYSPDGNHVAFISERSGKPSVWIADADGKNLAQIYSDGAAETPNWSPDSRKIAFGMLDQASLLWSVYTADISDRVAHRLKTNTPTQQTPYWSHDGKWIYFLDYQGSAHRFYRCPASGGDAELLRESVDANVPLQTVDGRLLYFEDRPGKGYSTMLELDRPDAAPQKVPLMPDRYAQASVKVAANGIYFSPRDNQRAISFYNFASKKTRELFSVDKDFADSISVSPDGRYILYSQTDETNANIMLVKNPR